MAVFDLVLYFTNTPINQLTRAQETAMKIANVLSAAHIASAVNASRVAKASTPTVSRSHRQRDFGVGYGNSSGYASERRYISEWTTPRFRMT